MTLIGADDFVFSVDYLNGRTFHNLFGVRQKKEPSGLF
jgi:hypothetical protein